MFEEKDCVDCCYFIQNVYMHISSI
jgi:hypothetical protein